MELTKHDLALRHYLFSLLRCEHAVDEVLQEAALVIWRKATEYDPDRPFFPWAAKFAYFKALEYRRQRRRQLPSLSPETLQQILEAADENAFDAVDRCQALRQCVAKLRDEDRDLLCDRYDRGMMIKEIASARSKTAKAVYNRLDRIRLKLATCITQQIEGAIDMNERTRRMVLRYLDGTIADDELAELDAALHGDPSGQQEFLRLAGVEYQLRTESISVGDVSAEAGRLIEVDREARGGVGRSRPHRSRRSFQWGWAAVVAGLLAVSGFAWWLTRQPSRQGKARSSFAQNRYEPSELAGAAARTGTGSAGKSEITLAGHATLKQLSQVNWRQDFRTARRGGYTSARTIGHTIRAGCGLSSSAGHRWFSKDLRS